MGIKDTYKETSMSELEDALSKMTDPNIVLSNPLSSVKNCKDLMQSLFFIDVDFFDRTLFEKHKSEEYKIYFMLIKFLHEFNIQLKNLVSVKSMENVAISLYTDMLNKNGDIFHYLQLELQKEAFISYWYLPHSLLSIRRSIDEISRNFSKFLYNIQYYTPNVIDNLYSFCKKYLTLNYDFEKGNIGHAYGLLHTFYLRLIEYKFKCIKLDEKSILDHMPEYYERRKKIF